MLKNVKKSKSEGFTIIEVMIVLAIAGLIMLIVFLAVPALQRNARNTQRKSEASALASAYSEYVNNHGGSAPGSAVNVTNNAKLSFYTAANVSYQTVANGATLAPNPNTDTVLVVQNASCDATKPYTTTVAAGNMVSYSSRGGVIVYQVEGGTAPTTTCISAN